MKPIYYQMTAKTARGHEMLNGKITQNGHSTIIEVKHEDSVTWSTSYEKLSEVQRQILLRRLEALRVIMFNKGTEERNAWDWNVQKQRLSAFSSLL
jgi:hypothetical protein